MPLMWPGATSAMETTPATLTSSSTAAPLTCKLTARPGPENPAAMRFCTAAPR